MHARLTLLLTLLLTPLCAQRLPFSWPVPSPEHTDGRSELEFLQATVSGDPASGGFGCVRSNGYQFHEGLDIKPFRRDRRGEPVDPVVAAIDGIVRHVNLHAGDSNYGRYIVIEHPDATPAIYTLYAHLSKIEPGITAGTRVTRGQVIAIMGHTAGGYRIPRDRAHLHFEMGLRLTDSFQSWYNWRRFGSPNEHGNYNGMNLVGFDPWDFIRRLTSHQINQPIDFIAAQRPVVRVRVATTQTPDFVRRYPSLVSRDSSGGLTGGWEVWCNETGLPFHWVKLTPEQVRGMHPNEVIITGADEDALKRDHCKRLVVHRRGRLMPGRDLDDVVDLLFGIR